ncbi:MAG: MBL fold metallo-hydrolase [Acholeplasmataceae bacterium]|nr:MBL fold metallo-hydrolase [Acholeplasmataceae bacterium]
MLKIWVRLLVCLSVIFSFAGCKTNISADAKKQAPVVKVATLQNTVQSKNLVVNVMNVGKADSILIQIGGKNYLIDTGLKENSNNLVEHLRALGVDKFDIIFMTHPHKDHIGGMPALLNSFKIKQVYDTELIKPDSKLYPKILKLIAEKHITKTKIQAPMKIPIADGAYFEVLWPVKQKITVPGDTNLNPNSLVMRLVYKDFSMMFAADSYKESEEHIIGLYPQDELKSNVLKVGHHGSNASTSDAWLNVVNPQVAIASYGVKKGAAADKYPSKKTVERIKAHNIKFYGTFVEGDVRVVTDGKAYSIETEKKQEGV